MSKILRRLATAAATLTVAAGTLLGAGAAASATTQATPTGDARTHIVQAAPHSKKVKWDGRRWWHRYSKHGDWYSTDHGRRYRFDGHRFYRWTDGKWKRVSSSYAHHHGLKRHTFRNNNSHHGHNHGR